MLKRFIIFVFFIINIFILNSQNDLKDDKFSIITENWVNNQLIIREQKLMRGESYEIFSYDSDLLTTIEENSFNEQVENALSKLLIEIIVTNKYFNIKNVIKGLSILKKQFKNKKYYFDISLRIITSPKIKNYAVLSSILDGYASIMDESNYKQIFDNFNYTLPEINNYIYDQRKEGHKIVITTLMNFLLKYIELVQDEKIKDTERKKVIELCDKLEMNQKVSQFENYNKGKELKENYFFYKDKK